VIYLLCAALAVVCVVGVLGLRSCVAVLHRGIG
jgi:hypothetical protein